MPKLARTVFPELPHHWATSKRGSIPLLVQLVINTARGLLNLWLIKPLNML
jgi:hypothetical protein